MHIGFLIAGSVVQGATTIAGVVGTFDYGKKAWEISGEKVDNLSVDKDSYWTRLKLVIAGLFFSAVLGISSVYLSWYLGKYILAGVLLSPVKHLMIAGSIEVISLIAFLLIDRIYRSRGSADDLSIIQ